MNPQTRPFAYPTVSPSARPETPATPIANTASALESDMRWNKWAEKGAREEAAFKEKARMLGTIAAVALGAAALVWVVVVVAF